MTSSEQVPYVFEQGNLDPSATTIIWLHGGTESHHEFTTVLSYLPANKYHNILLDLPGHGVQSTDDFTMSVAMNQLANIIDQYAHSKCYIIGFSLGGVTTLSLLRNRPEVFQGKVSKIFL